VDEFGEGGVVWSKPASIVRVGAGSEGLVSPGRCEKETGKRREVEAAVSAVATRVAELSGPSARTKRESLIVGPVMQPAAWREERAAARAQSSRWPQQMLMARRVGVPEVARAVARSTHKGWRRTAARMRRVSSRSLISVWQWEKGMRQESEFGTLIMADMTCLGFMAHLARVLRAIATRRCCERDGTPWQAAMRCASSCWQAGREEASSREISSSNWSRSCRKRVWLMGRVWWARDQEPTTEEK